MSGPQLSSQPRWAWSLVSVARPNELLAAVTHAIPRFQNWQDIAAVSANRLEGVRIDPAEWEIYERRLQWFYKLSIWSNATACGQTMRFFATKITATTGSGANGGTGWVGSEIAGTSSPTIALPANMAGTIVTSPLFDISEAGVYTIGAQVSGGFAALSGVTTVSQIGTIAT